MKYFKREAVDIFHETENLEAAFQQTDKETINPGTDFYYRRSQRRKEGRNGLMTFWLPYVHLSIGHSLLDPKDLVFSSTGRVSLS